MNLNHKTTPYKGFTLIELMLAMGFFASILMVSTIVVVQLFAVYNKGITVKQINGIGRTFTDDIIRIGNASVANVSVGGDSGDGRARCVRLGANIYIWSYDDDRSDPGSVYTSGSASSPSLVQFSRLKEDLTSTNPPTVCPALGFIPSNKLEPMLAANVRVYDADIKAIGDADDMLRFRIVLGTYAGDGSTNNPRVDGATGAVTCNEGSLGNYCAFGSYDTVIYLPNS